MKDIDIEKIAKEINPIKRDIVRLVKEIVKQEGPLSKGDIVLIITDNSRSAIDMLVRAGECIETKDGKIKFK